jgi:hypothetical protein
MGSSPIFKQNKKNLDYKRLLTSLSATLATFRTTELSSSVAFFKTSTARLSPIMERLKAAPYLTLAFFHQSITLIKGSKPFYLQKPQG